MNSPIALPDYATAMLFASGAALCYLNSHWLRVRWAELFEHEFDSAFAAGLTYLGGVLTLLGAWLAWPGMWTAVAWAVLALALNFAAKQMRQRSLALQGNVIAVAALCRLVTLNLFSADKYHGFSLRLITVGLTALLLYVAAPFASAADDDEAGAFSWITAAYTWAASVLVGLLVWYEVATPNIALGWMMLGIVLLEIGLQLKAGFLRWQGYAALAASFLQMLIANLDVTTRAGELSPRSTHVVPLAAAYYYADLRLRQAQTKDPDRAGPVFSYLGTISVGALLYFELAPAWVAAGWAALALALIIATWALKRRENLYQSYLLVAACALRAITFNFLQPSIRDVLFGGQRYYIGAAIALLFGGLPVAFALRRSVADPLRRELALASYPERVFFFVPFGLLTALIAEESSRGQLTVNWGIEGVAVFLLAVWVGERSFRLAGLGLLLACVVKIFLIDVWGLEDQARYITLISLGGALLLVSYLYTRYKEKFQRYL